MSKKLVLSNMLHASSLKNQFHILLYTTATVTRFIVNKVSDSEIRCSKITIVGLYPHVQYPCCFKSFQYILVHKECSLQLHLSPCCK